MSRVVASASTAVWTSRGGKQRAIPATDKRVCVSRNQTQPWMEYRVIRAFKNKIFLCGQMPILKCTVQRLLQRAHDGTSKVADAQTRVSETALLVAKYQSKC